MGMRDGVLDLAYPDLLGVVDVSDPTAPRKLATVPRMQGAWPICLHEAQLYVGFHRGGVSVENISDPAAPKVLGRDFDGGESQGVWEDGRLLNVVDYMDGFDVPDTRVPSGPSQVAEYIDVYSDQNLASDGVHVCLGDARLGLVIVQFGGLR